VNSVSGSDCVWYPTRCAVYARDGHRCLACGATEKLSLDHVVPRSRGGSSRATNLITLCISCNSSRGSKTVAAWRPELVLVVRRQTRRKLDRAAARVVAFEQRPQRILADRARKRRGPIVVEGCPF
jgi:hypothetical protein